MNRTGGAWVVHGSSSCSLLCREYTVRFIFNLSLAQLAHTGFNEHGDRDSDVEDERQRNPVHGTGHARNGEGLRMAEASKRGPGRPRKKLTTDAQIETVRVAPPSSSVRSHQTLENPWTVRASVKPEAAS